MTKGTWFYIIALGAFGVGLWAILSLGSIFLSAPTDLNGEWELRPRAELIGDNEALPAPAHVLKIEQSGLYLRVSIDGAAPRSMMLQRHDVERPAIGADRTHLEIASAGLRITLEGKARAEEYAATADGPLAGEWEATRKLGTGARGQSPTTRAAAQGRTARSADARD